MNITPKDSDAEKAVLSCMLLAPESMVDRAASELNARSFFEYSNRIIFEAIIDMRENNRELPDVLTLTANLRDKGQLESAGGASFISDLLNELPTVAVYPQYCKRLKEMESRRMMIAVCGEFSTMAYDMQEDVETLLDRFETDVMSMQASKDASMETMRIFSEVLISTMVKIEERYLAGGEIPGISTGFERLDTMSNGFQEQQLWVIAGRPGAGKTAALMNLVDQLCTNRRCSIAVFSAEMSSEQLAMRALSARAGIDGLQLSRGEINKGDFKSLVNTVQSCKDWNLVIDDKSSMKVSYIRRKTRQAVRERGVKIVFVDYLQLLSEEDGSRNREDAIRRISAGLKNLAKELKITVVALAQLSREPERRTGGKPKVSDLRDSGSIEQDADAVCLIHPHPDNAEDELTPRYDFIVGKMRGGEIGTIAMKFKKQITQFVELTTKELESERFETTKQGSEFD